MTATKYFTSAETTKMLKAELTKKWPTIKFSVTSRTRSVNVSWVDGPSSEKVNAIAKRYEGASFDGMTDYEDSVDQTRAIDGAIVKVHYCVSYVFVNRHLSDKAMKDIATKLMDRYGYVYNDFSTPNYYAREIENETEYA